MDEGEVRRFWGLEEMRPEEILKLPPYRLKVGSNRVYLNVIQKPVEQDGVRVFVVMHGRLRKLAISAEKARNMEEIYRKFRERFLRGKGPANVPIVIRNTGNKLSFYCELEAGGI